MILLVRPTWDQIWLYVAPELKWVWHLLLIHSVQSQEWQCNNTDITTSFRWFYIFFKCRLWHLWHFVNIKEQEKFPANVLEREGKRGEERGRESKRDGIGCERTLALPVRRLSVQNNLVFLCVNLPVSDHSLLLQFSNYSVAFVFWSGHICHTRLTLTDALVFYLYTLLHLAL